MPPEIKWSYPNANISVGNWDGKADDADGVCAWVAGTDPLFGQVADEWMQIMIADWGTDHWYGLTSILHCPPEIHDVLSISHTSAKATTITTDFIDFYPQP